MPLDPWPERRGRFVFTGEIDDMERHVVHYLKSDESYQGLTMYSSHFATCSSKQPAPDTRPEVDRFM